MLAGHRRDVVLDERVGLRRSEQELLLLAQNIAPLPIQFCVPLAKMKPFSWIVEVREDVVLGVPLHRLGRAR